MSRSNSKWVLFLVTLMSLEHVYVCVFSNSICIALLLCVYFLVAMMSSLWLIQLLFAASNLFAQNKFLSIKCSSYKSSWSCDIPPCHMTLTWHTQSSPNHSLVVVVSGQLQRSGRLASGQVQSRPEEEWGEYGGAHHWRWHRWTQLQVCKTALRLC